MTCLEKTINMTRNEVTTLMDKEERALPFWKFTLCLLAFTWSFPFFGAAYLVGLGWAAVRHGFKEGYELVE